MVDWLLIIAIIVGVDVVVVIVTVVVIIEVHVGLSSNYNRRGSLCGRTRLGEGITGRRATTVTCHARPLTGT